MNSNHHPPTTLEHFKLTWISLMIIHTALHYSYSRPRSCHRLLKWRVQIRVHSRVIWLNGSRLWEWEIILRALSRFLNWVCLFVDWINSNWHRSLSLQWSGRQLSFTRIWWLQIEGKRMDIEVCNVKGKRLFQLLFQFQGSIHIVKIGCEWKE